MGLELHHLTPVILLLKVILAIVHAVRLVLLLAIMQVGLVKTMILLHTGDLLSWSRSLAGVHQRRRRGRRCGRRSRRQQTVDRRSILTRRDGVLGIHFQAAVAELAILLRLHPPILEPDFNLTLGQAQCLRYLDTPSSGQVSIKMELLLELQSLETGVRLSGSFLPAAIRVA